MSSVDSRAASFKRPLLSVDVSMCLSVCVSATLMLNISETIAISLVRVQWGPYRKVRIGLTARRLVTSSMMSRDSMMS